MRLAGFLTATRTRCWLCLLAGLGLALVPTPALANGGSALVWTGVLHLLVANLVIGYIEGSLVARWFRLPRRRAIALLVAANYLSAWVGLLTLAGRISRSPVVTIENVHLWIGGFWLLAFVLTNLIEYPFVWWLLRDRKRPKRTALVVTLVVHGVTYLLLLGWYSLSSEMALITQLERVPADAVQPIPGHALVYTARDGQQMRLDLEGVAQDPEAIGPGALDPGALDPGDLDPGVLNPGNNGTVEGAIANASFGALPPPATSDWQWYARTFNTSGLTGTHLPSGERLTLALETPFVTWPVSHAAHLPGDTLVFQLGADQICILQPQSREIALIARGTDPVVVPQ